MQSIPRSVNKDMKLVVMTIVLSFDTTSEGSTNMFSEWILERGSDLQVGLFFATLALFLCLERLLPRRTKKPDRQRQWTNWSLTTLNVIALIFLPVSFIGAAMWFSPDTAG